MEKLQPENYNSVINELSTIYETTLLNNEIIQSNRKKESYWRMGQCISRLIDEKSEDKIHTKKVLSQIRTDMTSKYGKGFSLRSIHYMRNFASEYKLKEISKKLSWSHYCILLSIKDKNVRKQFEQEAIASNTGRNQLQQQVAYYLQQTDENTKEFPLQPRNASPDIVKVIKESKDSGVMLDLGFGVTIEPALRSLNKYPHSTYLLRGKNGLYKKIECTGSQRYCYKGTVQKVVDGDTVKIRIELAPKICITQRFRLRGVDAMELNTDEGIKAKKALTKMLKNKKEITVYTYGNDKYGRYIADLVANQTYINKELVQNHHARYLSMTAL